MDSYGSDGVVLGRDGDAMTWTGPMMFAIAPPVFCLAIFLQTLAVKAVRSVVGESHIAFAGVQFINLCFGVVWGSLFACSIYWLTGFPHDPLDPSGPGYINVFLMLLPAVVFTLREDGYASGKLAIPAMCAVMSFGLFAGLQQNAEDRKPGIGLHVMDVAHGSRIFAQTMNEQGR